MLMAWGYAKNTTKKRLTIQYHPCYNVYMLEIAHALTKGHGHDRVWKAKCVEIGGKGLTYYNEGDRNVYNPNPTKRSNKIYQLECQECGYTGGRYRRRMNGYRHRGCGGDMESVELL
jgi:hypothetical protein